MVLAFLLPVAILMLYMIALILGRRGGIGTVAGGFTFGLRE